MINLSQNVNKTKRKLLSQSHRLSNFLVISKIVTGVEGGGGKEGKSSFCFFIITFVCKHKSPI